MKRDLKGWIKTSFRVPGSTENPWMAFDYQSIGKLDDKLNNLWDEIKDNLSESDNIMKFDELCYLSKFWVLGAYELLRVIKNLDSSQKNMAAYEKFRRIRIPLAKYEPANGTPCDYYSVALPALSNDKKFIGWAIGPKEMVSRDDLADLLYNLYT